MRMVCIWMINGMYRIINVFELASMWNDSMIPDGYRNVNSK